MQNYDAKALQVAQLAQAYAQPEFAVLFGSRARGDHNDRQSDIDVLLVAPDTPDAARRQAAERNARDAARVAYGHEVPVQLVWRTVAEFRRNRRYTNSVETNAIREGIIMPRDPNNYRAADYDDAETEYEYNWTNYDNRLFHAEQHLQAFRLLVENDMHDLLIGQQAQSALEHGLKALLESHGFSQGQHYRDVHDIGELIGNVRYRIPELNGIRLSIAPDIYSEYAGMGEYKETRANPQLTAQADYLARTVADVDFIIAQARAARARARAALDE